MLVTPWACPLPNSEEGHKAIQTPGLTVISCPLQRCLSRMHSLIAHHFLLAVSPVEFLQDMASTLNTSLYIPS